MLTVDEPKVPTRLSLETWSEAEMRMNDRL